MLELLIIADDYTGALDSGVQLAAAGARTKVVTDPAYDFAGAEDAEVVVIDTESRHLAAANAYQIVYDITRRAARAGIPHIFKKTDSALRGNVGAELTAALEASGEAGLPFIPAFPKMHRTTEEGCQYVDGELLENSVFAQDPFEPTRHSYIPDIIAEESGIRTELIPFGEVPERNGADADGPVIWIFDCSTDQEMEGIAARLMALNLTRLMAGCAGAASILPGLLGLHRRAEVMTARSSHLFAVCGSVNPITVKQLAYAERHGFVRHRLTPQEKLEENYWQNPAGAAKLHGLIQEWTGEPLCIVDSNDPQGSGETAAYAAANKIDAATLRKRIPASLGTIVRERLQVSPPVTLMVMGGDTLMGFFTLMGIREVSPICELFPGVVLSTFTWQKEKMQIITKSGGFGRESLLTDIAAKVMREDSAAQTA